MRTMPLKVLFLIFFGCAPPLLQMHDRLERWMQKTNGHGRTLEPDAVYGGNMVGDLKKGKDPEIERNIALMKQWAKEGK